MGFVQTIAGTLTPIAVQFSKQKRRQQVRGYDRFAEIQRKRSGRNISAIKLVNGLRLVLGRFFLEDFQHPLPKLAGLGDDIQPQTRRLAFRCGLCQGCIHALQPRRLVGEEKTHLPATSLEIGYSLFAN